MANAIRSRNDNLLNAWQRVCMAEQWLFNQASGKGAPIASAADKGETVYLQFERERIASGLQNAVNNVAAQMHFWPRPTWFTQTIPLARSTPFWWQEHTTQWRKLIAFGQRGTSVIQAAAAVVYSDSTGQGVNDTATITVANPNAINVDEVQVFYQVADGALGAADTRFQIEPLKVVSSGGNLVITGHRSLFVSPAVWTVPYVITDPNGRNPNATDTMSAAGFVTAVDVYRVFNDTTVSISLEAPDGTILQNFNGEIINSELGFFRLGGNLCSAASTWCGQYPSRLQVYYYAGEALQNGQMDTELEDRIISYANAEMDELYSSFSSWTLNRLKRDQEPMVEKMAGMGGVSLLAHRDANNPFGLRKGQVRAWQLASGPRALQTGGKFSRSVR